MDFFLFFKSFLLGLAVAAPLGPIGALCISRTLDHGFWLGFSGGVGTAIADAVFACLSALGFAAFAATLVLIDVPMRMIGGLFMIWLGWQNIRASTPASTLLSARGSSLKTMGTTFGLTITNPMTVLSFSALFAGLGLASNPTLVSGVMVVFGVFLGSLSWWAFLSGIVTVAKRKLPEHFSKVVSQVSGVILLIFGSFAILSGFNRWTEVF